MTPQDVENEFVQRYEQADSPEDLKQVQEIQDRLTEVDVKTGKQAWQLIDEHESEKAQSELPALKKLAQKDVVGKFFKKETPGLDK